MGELQAILDALAAERAAGRAAVLATVVGVAGSGYRRPGARMLVTAAGRVGSVSGGCLENDVCRRAWWLTEAGPAVVSYDTADDGGGPYRLGCGGTVQVLLERVGPGPEPAGLAAVRAALERGESAAVATVVSASGGFPAGVGARWVLGRDGPTAGPPPELSVADAARNALATGRPRTVAVEAGGGRAEVLVEVVRPPVRLLVCGAGPDVGPVVRIAKQVGWRVTVADHRPAAALRGRFPDADAVVSGDPAAHPDLGVPDAAVVMTHSFPDDLAWLRLALASAARYVGVLGARHRTDQLVRDLGGADTRLFGPVGLDVGADTPAEIALAVVAEARAVLAGRGGGHLRDRGRPVHDPHPIPAGVIHPTPVAAVTVACDLVGGTP